MSQTVKNIEVLKWDKYPVESDTFTVSICITNKEERNQVEEYIKQIFPEECKDYSKTLTPPQSGKMTICFDFDKIKPIDWDDKIYINNKLYEKGHYIFSGGLDDFPDIVLTLSDLMIFSDEKECNTYLNKKHRMTLNNFDIGKSFIVIDKRKMGLDMKGLLREEVSPN